MDVLTAPGTPYDILFRLGAAVFIGAAIGINREIHEKPAGLRTHALVSLGAALFTMTGLMIPSAGLGLAPDALSRILQGIVTGVGFIGAGVIMHRGDSNGVFGLTTAASIWVAAGLGVASGAGLWISAVGAILLALVVLVLGAQVDAFIHRRRGR